ncbi:MAG: hypothetical protein ACREQI_02595 [Candidatus Binataceae bacterium]
MSNENKDRFGQKMQDVEAAREDQWARQKDAELLAKMRERTGAMACPHCKKPLVAKSENGLQMMACPADEGAWLDAPSLQLVLKK